MRVAILVVLLCCALCSCSPSRISSWSQEDDLTVYEAHGTDRRLRELMTLQQRRSREERATQQRKAGLPSQTTCPRCYRPVALSPSVMAGDMVRCGNCGKAFAPVDEANRTSEGHSRSE